MTPLEPAAPPPHPAALVAGEITRLRRQIDRLARENARLKRQELLLRRAVDSGGVGLWIADPAARRLDVSPAFKVLFGRSPDDALSYDDALAQVHPDDRARREAAIAESIASGRDYRIDYRVLWPNGEERQIEVRGAPVFGERRRLAALAGVCIDVTGRKRGEAREQLIREELSHRLKNAVTTVSALASQTLRTTDSAESFRSNFGARLEALGRSLAAPGEGEAPRTLDGVLRRALEPYVEADAERFTFDGPEVALGEHGVTALGLMAHELATNAMKYGALSNAGGRVSVRWSLDKGRVDLSWRESGGPPVVAPSRRGFGSRLIERAAPTELGGDSELTYAPDGLVCRLRFPLRS